MDRRSFLKSLSRTALVLPLSEVLLMAAPPPWNRTKRNAPIYDAQQSQMTRSYDAKPVAPPPGPASPIAGTPLGINFVDVATMAGLNAKTIYGGVGSNKYLLETTGCGAAFYDYDQDGWMDIFLVNGWRLEGFAKKAAELTTRLYKA